MLLSALIVAWFMLALGMFSLATTKDSNVGLLQRTLAMAVSFFMLAVLVGAAIAALRVCDTHMGPCGVCDYDERARTYGPEIPK